MRFKNYIFSFFLVLSSGCAGADKKAESSVQRHSPSAAGESSSQQGKLLDFKMEPAPWLKKHPAIQKKVQQIVKESKAEIQKSASALFKEFPKSALLPFKLHVTELRMFQPESSDIVSVRMKIYIYSGGAHGGTTYYNWNWSQKQKRFLSLKDIVPADQFPNLQTQTRKTLLGIQTKGLTAEQLSERFWIKPHIYRGTSRPEDFKVWNLHRNNILIVFPEYQVASYASGSFEVAVPLKNMK